MLDHIFGKVVMPIVIGNDSQYIYYAINIPVSGSHEGDNTRSSLEARPAL